MTGRASASRRRLIVNADDFGLSLGVNRGILAAHRNGIVTSASLMVRQSGAQDAATSCRARPHLSVGLHLDLGEWSCRGGDWIPLYEVVPLDDADAVAREARRQVELFRALVGRSPTHIDSHQHVHERDTVRAVALELARELAVPLRHHTPDVGYCGDFYGQTIEGESVPGAVGVDALLAILAEIPSGTTELSCHPAEDLDDVSAGTMYRAERLEELATLCHSRVRSALATGGIELRSFADVT